MARYAKGTKVPASQSRAEIEKTLKNYGATGFAYGWDQEKAMIGFQLCGKHIKLALRMPSRKDPDICETPQGWERTEKQIELEWEKACRQRWRALLLIIKAKLEAVENDITSLEEEFMAHLVLPDGRTAGQFLLPQIETAYKTAEMPALLPWEES